MPIYDYVCGSCGHRFEVLRGINEAGPRQCPECGGPVARAFVPPTIHFKGSGWAKTDRRATRAPARRADSGVPASGPPGSAPGSAPGGGSGTSAESSGSSAGAEATSSAGTPAPEKSTQSDTDH